MQEAVMVSPSEAPLILSSHGGAPAPFPLNDQQCVCYPQTDESFSMEKLSPFFYQTPDVKSDCPVPWVPGTAVGALTAPRQAPGCLAESQTGL